MEEDIITWLYPWQTEVRQGLYIDHDIALEIVEELEKKTTK